MDVLSRWRQNKKTDAVAFAINDKKDSKTSEEIIWQDLKAVTTICKI